MNKASVDIIYGQLKFTSPIEKSALEFYITN